MTQVINFWATLKLPVDADVDHVLDLIASGFTRARDAEGLRSNLTYRFEDVGVTGRAFVFPHKESDIGHPNTPIEKLNLPTKVTNLLRRYQMTTVRVVTLYSRTRLLKLKGFGPKTVDAIAAALMEQGQWLQPD